VDEYFLNFLHITLKTGLGLYDVLKQELSNLGICLSNCHGKAMTMVQIWLDINKVYRLEF